MLLLLTSVAFLSLLPPAGAVAAPSAGQEGCAAALAAEGTAWDGFPKESFTWGGDSQELTPFGQAPVTVCEANGPLMLLPASNRIGCVLVSAELARIEGRLACGPYRDIVREGDADLLWSVHVSAISSNVTRFYWNGSQLDVQESYVECWDGSRTDDALGCPLP